MISNFVLVTGQMRSGTSLVAHLAHVFGIPMAETMSVGPGGRAEPDFEDLMLLQELVRRVPLDGAMYRTRGFRPWFRKYVKYRIKIAKHWDSVIGEGQTRVLGAKSPFLSFFWTDVNKVLGSLGIAPRWLITHRNQQDVNRSVVRTFEKNGMSALEMNAVIRERCSEIEDANTVSYDRLVTEPEIGTVRLARMLGVKNVHLIERAYSKIHKEVA